MATNGERVSGVHPHGTEEAKPHTGRAAGNIFSGLVGAVIGATATAATVFLTPVANDWWEHQKAFRFEIIEPVQGSEVSASQGFTAKGTSQNLQPGNSLCC